MIGNISILVATFNIFKDFLQFPFTLEEVQSHLIQITEKQNIRLHSISLTTNFWECFMAALRSLKPDINISVDSDIKIDGDRLYFNWSSIYHKIAMEWWNVNHKAAPAKTSLKQALVTSKSYLESHSSIRFNSQKNTSAFSFSINEIPIKEELMDFLIEKGHMKNQTVKLDDLNEDGLDFQF